MLDLTDRCPSWCRHHDHEDDDTVMHQAVIGFAGPLEVSLVCWVFTHRPDPTTELQLHHLGHTSADRTMTLPLDLDVDQLGDLLRQAIATAQPVCGW